MTKKRLYILLFAASLVGYLWVGLQLYFNHPTIPLCFFKFVTHLPCPSCGSTRSVIEMVKGNFHQAILWNPLGVVSFLIMTISPFWIAFDVATKKETLLQTYLKVEIKIRKTYIAIPLIALVLANWIWNIYKGL